MYGNNRPGPYDRGNMGNGGGMGNGGMGGGPIRNNFNGPRGRMMRGGASELMKQPNCELRFNGQLSPPS